MKRKLIIISNDALVREDMEYLKTKPCIRELIEKGSFVESLKTVYPSITYCCHASMITGAYPNKTGVYNNEVDKINNRNWTWERKYIKVKTLIDAFNDKESYEAKPYLVRWYSIWASAFACIIVVAIAIPFSVAGVRTNPMVGVSKTVGLFFLYFVIDSIFSALGGRGYIPPLWASTIPVVAMMLFALSLYRKAI